MHERLDGIRKVRRFQCRWEIAVVTFHALDSVRQTRRCDDPTPHHSLRVTQRDAGAADREPLSQVTQACSDAAPEVHDVRSGERRVDASHERRDLVVDIVEGLVLGVGVGAPDCAMNRRAPLAETNERRGMPVVVAPDVGRVESRSYHATMSTWFTTIRDRPASRCSSLLRSQSAIVSARSGAISTAARAQPSISIR